MLSDTVYNRSSSPDLRGGCCPWKPLALGRTTPALACFHGVLHACVQVSSWKDTSRPGLRTSLLHDLILNSLPLWTPFLKKGACSSNRGWRAYMSFGGTQFRPTTGHMCVLCGVVGHPYCREQKSINAAVPGDSMACPLSSTRTSCS